MAALSCKRPAFTITAALLRLVCPVHCSVIWGRYYTRMLSSKSAFFGNVFSADIPKCISYVMSDLARFEVLMMMVLKVRVFRDLLNAITTGSSR
jgi:hypothetical protein